MKKKQWKTLLEFISPRQDLIKGIFFALVASLLYVPIPYITGIIVDMFSLNSIHTYFYGLLGVMALIYCAKYVTTIVGKLCFTKVQQHTITNIKLKLLYKTMKLPMEYIQKQEKGYLMSRLSEPEQLATLFSSGYINILIGGVEFLMSACMALYLNLYMGIFLIVTVPLYYLIIRKSSKKIGNATHSLMESSADSSGATFETINGLEEIKNISAFEYHINKVKSRILKVIEKSIEYNKIILIFSENIQLTHGLITVIVLLASGLLIASGQISVGLYLTLSIYITKSLSVVQAYASLGVTLKPLGIILERTNEYLGLDEEMFAKGEQITSIDKIEFKNVNFQYADNSESILNHFSYTFNKSHQILIKGKIGSGKSTIAKLILGLYKPQQGIVEINQIDINLIDRLSLRAYIGIVSQNIFLFRGTVYENIVCGDTNVMKDDVIVTLQKYNLIGFLDNLNDGLDTLISQDGYGVSGGQKRIIAILRVLLSKKRIIILDEATSNIDLGTTATITRIFQDTSLYDMLIVISHEDTWDFIEERIELN